MTKPLFVEPRGLGQHEPFVLRSRRVVLPDGEHPATLHIEGGRIRAIAAWEDTPAGLPLHDAGEDALLPGLVDIHVHLNEPGPESHFEGFRAGGQAALRGGITTILDMPLNSIPVTTTPEALEAKRAAAKAANCPVRVGFIGGLVPANADRMEELIDAGVVAVKAFLCDSGLPEFPAAREEDLRIAMPVLARRGVPLFVHAELVDELANPKKYPPKNLADWKRQRPVRFELNAIQLMIDLCRETRCPVHIVHVATHHARPLLKKAKEEGLPITAETCPHYVFPLKCRFGFPIPLQRLAKCAPPIRDTGSRDGLWAALREGTIDLIASDHSPCHPALKDFSKPFAEVWGGVSSLGLALPLINDRIQKSGHYNRNPNDSLSHLAKWLSSAPARTARLPNGIGMIAVGSPADIVQFDPLSTVVIKESELPLTHPENVLYVSMKFRGLVKNVWLGGRQHEVGPTWSIQNEPPRP